MGKWKAIIASVLVLCSLAGQAMAQARATPFYGDAGEPAQQPLLEVIKGAQLAERMAAVVNTSLTLRSDLHVGFRSCKVANAFFNPQAREITICLEFIQLVAKTAAEDNYYLMKLPRQEFSRYVDGAVWSVFLHELGHAVIAINQVPVTGREEDVADQFAVWFAVRFVTDAQKRVVEPGVWFWNRLAQTRDLSTFSTEERKRFMANEHSLDEQRVYNQACWAYGTGTEAGYRVAQRAGLPRERMQRCDQEWSKLNTAMTANFRPQFRVLPLSGRW